MRQTICRSIKAALAIAVLCTANFVSAQEPNNSFGTATVLAPDVRVVDDEIGEILGGGFPDTILGAFDEFDFLIESSDDGSDFGNSEASGLFSIAVNDDGTIRLSVTGFADFDFDGVDDFSSLDRPHEESGDFDLFIDVELANGDVIRDAEVLSGTLLPGDVVEFVVTDPNYIGGFFTANIDNTVGDPDVESDLDFFRFTGLTPGAPFVAEVVQSIEDVDTFLGLFDESGAIIATDDDGGLDVLSRLTGVAPASGEIVVAVTGFEDDDFRGFHEEFGDYRLVVTQVPEPSTAGLLALVTLSIGGLRRRFASR